MDKYKKRQGEKMPVFFAGTPAKLVEDTTYNLTYAYGILSGQIYLTFDNESKKQKLKEILDFYLKHPKLSDLLVKSDQIKAGLMVVAVSEDRKLAIRGQLGDMLLDKMNIPVLDVDAGRILTFPQTSFHYILEEHLMEPFLTFECVLEGLEFFRSSPFYGKALKLKYPVLEGKKLQGTCTGFYESNYSKGIPMLRIRDVDMDLDFNSVMLKTIYQLCPGDFPTQQNVRKPCYVVHSEITGEFYIQMDSSYVTDLEYLLTQTTLEEVLKMKNGYKAGELSKDAVYIAPQSSGDVNLYRAKFVGLADSTSDVVTARLFYMDYGNEDTIPIDRIRSASVINRHLERIPALCHKVYLKWVKGVLNYEELTLQVENNMYQVEIRSGTREGRPIVVLSWEDENGAQVILNHRLVSKGIVKPSDKVTFKKQH